MTPYEDLIDQYDALNRQFKWGLKELKSLTPHERHVWMIRALQRTAHG